MTTLVVTPLAALGVTSAAKSSQPVAKLTAAEKSIFDITGDNVLNGFKKGTTKKEIAQYCKDGVCSLPTGIKAIGKDAFNMYKKIGLPEGVTKVVLPKTLTSIGDFAFYANPITEVAYEDEEATSITSIGESTFSNCTNLQSFKFLTGLQTVGKSAFSGCKNLSTFDFSNFANITELLKIKFGDNAFSSIYVPAGTGKGNVSVKSNIVEDVPVDTKDMHMGLFLSNLYAAGLHGIYGNAPTWLLTGYQYGSTSTAYHPVPVQWLKTEMVNGVNTLTGIQPKHLADVKECDTLYIPQTNNQIQTTAIQTISSNFKFLNGTSTVAKKIGFRYLWCEDNSLTSIPSNVCKDNNLTHFSEDKVLLLARLPEQGLTAIDQSAFENCSSLTYLNINDIKTTETNANPFTTVGKRAFYNCNKLASLSFVQEDHTKLSLPVTTNNIGEEAFYGCGIMQLLLFAPKSNLTVGSHAFANLTKLNEIDMSKLNYAYEGTGTGRTINHSCAFRKWFDSADKAGKIFGGLSAEFVDQHIKLPISYTDPSVIVDPATFMDVPTKSEKANAKEYSGFYWLCQQSSPSNNFQESPIYSWDQTGEAQITGGSVTMIGSKTKSETFVFTAKEGYSPSTITLETMQGYDFDSETITFDSENKMVCTNGTKLGNNTPRGVYLFRVKAVFTKAGSDDLVCYSDLITLRVGEELNVTGATSIIDEDGQANHRDITPFVAMPVEGSTPENVVYSFVKADSDEELNIPGFRIDTQSSDKTGLITWTDGQVTTDTPTSFRVKAYAYNSTNGYFYEGYSPVVNMEIASTRNLVIDQKGLTSLETESGQASTVHDIPTFTASLAGRTDFDAKSIQWSVSESASNLGVKINNGKLYWDSLTATSGTVTFTVSLHIVEKDTDYYYEATTQSITLKVGKARTLKITNDGPIDLTHKIVHENGQTIKPTQTTLLLKFGDAAAIAQEQQWSFDPTTPAIDGLSLNSQTGVLDWTNVDTTGGDKQFKINAHLIEKDTAYVYDASITVTFNIDAKRTLSINNGINKLQHQSGQPGGIWTTAFTASISKGSTPTGVNWTVTDPSGNAINGLGINTSGQLTWDAGLNYSGDAVVHANYTEASTGYKYSANKTISIEMVTTKSLTMTDGAVTWPLNPSWNQSSGAIGFYNIKLDGQAVDKSRVTIVTDSGEMPKGTYLDFATVSGDARISVMNDYPDYFSGTKTYKFHVEYNDPATESHPAWVYKSASKTLTFTFQQLDFTNSGTSWEQISTCCHAAEAGKYTLSNVMKNTAAGNTRTFRADLTGSTGTVINNFQLVIADSNKQPISNNENLNSPSRFNGLNINGSNAALTFLFNNPIAVNADNTALAGYTWIQKKDKDILTNLWSTSFLRSSLNKLKSNFERTEKVSLPSVKLTTFNGYYYSPGTELTDDYIYVPSIANFYSSDSIRSALFPRSDDDTKNKVYYEYSTIIKSKAWDPGYAHSGIADNLCSGNAQYQYFVDGGTAFKKFLGWTHNDSDSNKRLGLYISGNANAYPYWLREPYADEANTNYFSTIMNFGTGSASRGYVATTDCPVEACNKYGMHYRTDMRSDYKWYDPISKTEKTTIRPSWVRAIFCL